MSFMQQMRSKSESMQLLDLLLPQGVFSQGLKASSLLKKQRGWFQWKQCLGSVRHHDVVTVIKLVILELAALIGNIILLCMKIALF
jgi:hypothetical protein